jgi:hypothetical protein
MTVHILISLLTLLLLIWILNKLTINYPQEHTRWFPLSLIALFLLPMSFRFIIPISHFIFEVTSDNILWFKILYGFMWLLAGYFLWRYKTKGVNLKHTFPYVFMWAVMGFWYYLGMSLSGYEPGIQTPTLSDSGLYIAQWISVHIVFICLFFLLFFSSDYYKSKARTITSFMLLALYLFLSIS